MQDREPTIRSRVLGDRLREAILSADLTGKQCADKLGWAQSTISRLLAGKHFAKEIDISALLAICGVVGEERRHLLQLAKEVHILGGAVPCCLETYPPHEAKARRIIEFQCVALPEIIQTEGYSRALLTEAGHPATLIEQQMQARQNRASLLDRLSPPRCEFIVHEGLLRVPVGGRDVMSEQLHHLLRLSVLPFLTLRILPISAGALAAQSGPFRLLDFHDFTPFAHHANEHYDMYMEERQEVMAYRRIVVRMMSVSLDEKQSRNMINELIISTL
jgi:transcriptional regulator with XRE-family HTH domain